MSRVYKWREEVEWGTSVGITITVPTGWVVKRVLGWDGIRNSDKIASLRKAVWLGATLTLLFYLSISKIL